MQETNPTQPFKFSGTGGEYFRIWIVNLFLTIITLTIYSAWASVRKAQYFYRHTSVAGASFDYHGNPKAILKGRIIATVLFGTYSALSHTKPLWAFAVLGVILLVMPWLVVRSLRFRLHNSSYRGLRFSFTGTTKGGYLYFLLFPILGYITAGLAWPWAKQRMTHFIRTHSRYGNAFFSFHATAGQFYKPYAAVLLGVIGFFIIAVIVAAAVGVASAFTGSGILSSKVLGFISTTVFIFYIVMILLIYPYITSRLQNLIWNHTQLGVHYFESSLSARGLLWIFISNLFLVIITFGLYKPFADIRLIKYKFEHLALKPGSNLDEFLAGQQVAASAAGEEITDMFDLDIAI